MSFVNISFFLNLAVKYQIEANNDIKFEEKKNTIRSKTEKSKKIQIETGQVAEADFFLSILKNCVVQRYGEQNMKGKKQN